MFYQSLLKNVRRASILYFRQKWRCVWQTLWLESKSLIIPSHFTTQMDMLKSGENNNQAANPPGYLLSDIKRRSLSSLLDRIPRKKEPCYSCWAAEPCCCYRKWWLVSAFNDFCSNFRLTLAKKSDIAKISQILELLCFFSCFTVSSRSRVSPFSSWNSVLQRTYFQP